jgi:DNA-binding beta-propeller fold protein YncE
VDKEERVWVADRENSRIQIFDSHGKFLEQKTDLIRPTDIFIDDENTVYVTELCERISILTIDGKLLARWTSGEQNKETALFMAPHSIAVDSQGDIYVGESSMSHLGGGVNRGTRALQKFSRVVGDTVHTSPLSPSR